MRGGNSQQSGIKIEKGAIKMKEEIFGIENEAFNDLRADFNGVLQLALQQIDEKGFSGATLNLKLKIDMEQITHTDADGAVSRVLVPHFEFETTSTLKQKVGSKGRVKGEYAIIQMPTGEYMLRAATDGQMSMF